MTGSRQTYTAYLELPAREQMLLDIAITNEEVGHYGLTMRESHKPLVYEAAEKFIKACKTEYQPGMIGLFSLQGALAPILMIRTKGLHSMCLT